MCDDCQTNQNQQIDDSAMKLVRCQTNFVPSDFYWCVTLQSVPVLCQEIGHLNILVVHVGVTLTVRLLLKKMFWQISFEMESVCYFMTKFVFQSVCVAVL